MPACLAQKHTLIFESIFQLQADDELSIVDPINHQGLLELILCNAFDAYQLGFEDYTRSTVSDPSDGGCVDLSNECIETYSESSRQGWAPWLGPHSRTWEESSTSSSPRHTCSGDSRPIYHSSY